jgi:hypothetical protein
VRRLLLRGKLTALPIKEVSNSVLAQPIRGDRYECKDCAGNWEGFDFCEKCIMSSDETHDGHTFTREAPEDEHVDEFELFAREESRQMRELQRMEKMERIARMEQLRHEIHELEHEDRGGEGNSRRRRILMERWKEWNGFAKKIMTSNARILKADTTKGGGRGRRDLGFFARILKIWNLKIVTAKRGIGGGRLWNGWSSFVAVSRMTLALKEDWKNFKPMSITNVSALKGGA